MDSESERTAPGPLVLKTIGNSCFFISPDGVKQIVVGHTCDEQFEPVIKFYKHSKAQNGLALNVAEWRAFYYKDGDIDAEFRRGGYINDMFYLGTPSKYCEFRKIIRNKCLVIAERSQSQLKYPREIALQEKTWIHLKTLIRSIDSVVVKAVDDQRKFQQLFSDICDEISTKCLYLDENNVSKCLDQLSANSFSEKSQFSSHDFNIAFVELKHACRDLIIDKVLEGKVGFNFRQSQI